MDSSIQDTSSGLAKGVVGVGPARHKFVLFGSSIVQFSFIDAGWGAHLAHLYSRKADIFLRGYSGWNSRRAVKVLDKIFPRNAATQPSLVIVYFGGNDAVGPHPSGLGPHVPLSEYVDNMRQIATHVKGLSDTTRIIFLTCPPVNESQIRKNCNKRIAVPERTNRSLQKYSNALIELCEEMDVKVIDLWTAIQNKDDWLNTCFTDGIHLTAEGSKIVVKEILKVLKEADWNPKLHWSSIDTEFSENSPYDPVAHDGKSTVNVSKIRSSL